MRRTRFDHWDCPVARTVDILGDWWTPLVLRSAFLGVRRFDDFVESLGIPRNVLTTRLDRLVEEGLLDKVEYQDRPPRFEYRLTDKGLGLYPVMVGLHQWGNQWFDWGDEGLPVRVVDRATGRPIEPILVDAATGRELDPRQTMVVYRDDITNAGRPTE